MTSNRTVRIGGWLAAVAFALALTLEAAPQLHERVHPDAGTANHECAVTLVASGSFHHAVAPPLITERQPIEWFVAIPELNSAFVLSAFLSASVFEHAPPVLS